MTEISNKLAEMGILDHLGELRRRLLWSALILCVSAIICYSFVGIVFEFLSRPFLESFPTRSLIGTGPAEALTIKIKVAIFAGLILGLPLFSYQFWKFIQPALYENEQKSVLPVAFSFAFLFIAGVLFCHYLVLPLAFSFFASQYSSIGLEPNIRISEQISTSLSMLVSFGVIFEMPLAVYILSILGLITSRTLISTSRYAIVVIFIVSAVLTPPDVISQFLMAIPLIFLYGISILIAKKFAK
jgi:sec-independent protein translocase protein TatC